MIKPIKGFKEFTTNFSDKVHKVGSEIKLSRTRIRIFVNTEGNKVEFILTSPDNITTFKLIESRISKKELNEMSEIFRFRVIPHKYHPNISVGSLGFIHNDYNLACYFLIKKRFDKHFAMLYAKRGESIFVNNILYIHGIWEVEVSNEFLSRVKS